MYVFFPYAIRTLGRKFERENRVGLGQLFVNPLYLTDSRIKEKPSSYIMYSLRISAPAPATSPNKKFFNKHIHRISITSPRGYGSHNLLNSLHSQPRRGTQRTNCFLASFTFLQCPLHFLIWSPQALASAAPIIHLLSCQSSWHHHVRCYMGRSNQRHLSERPKRGFFCKFVLPSTAPGSVSTLCCAPLLFCLAGCLQLWNNGFFGTPVGPQFPDNTAPAKNRGIKMPAPRASMRTTLDVQPMEFPTVPPSKRVEPPLPIREPKPKRGTFNEMKALEVSHQQNFVGWRSHTFGFPS